MNSFTDIISLDDTEILIKDETTEILFGNFAITLLYCTYIRMIFYNINITSIMRQ